MRNRKHFHWCSQTSCTRREASNLKTSSGFCARCTKIRETIGAGCTRRGRHLSGRCPGRGYHAGRLIRSTHFDTLGGCQLLSIVALSFHRNSIPFSIIRWGHPGCAISRTFAPSPFIVQCVPFQLLISHPSSHILHSVSPHTAHRTPLQRFPIFIMSQPTQTTPLLPSSRPLPPIHTRPPPALLLALVPLVITLPMLYLINVSDNSTTHQSLDTSHPITLAALGDWGRYGLFGQTRVANALASTMTGVSTRAAVLSTGDNFYQTGVKGLHDPQFNSSFEAVYSHLPLRTVPWYSILGNHDHLGSIQAQTTYTTRSTRWRMPAPYYSQRLTPHLLAIFLDTTPFVDGNYGKIARDTNRQNPTEQLNWFKSLLKNADPNVYFLIVAHHNMYSMSTDDHLGVAEIRNAFEPVIKPYHNRLIAYVSGHEHALMHMQPYPSDDEFVVDHFLSGAGSKLSKIVEPLPTDQEKWFKCCGILPVSNRTDVPRTVWGQSVHGFFVFTFDGSHFEARVVNDSGDIIYSYEKDVPPI